MEVFFKDWRFASHKDNVHCKVELPKVKTEGGDAGIQIVSSGPDSKWPSIKDGYLKMIANARERIYIQTPYLYQMIVYLKL